MRARVAHAMGEGAGQAAYYVNDGRLRRMRATHPGPMMNSPPSWEISPPSAKSGMPDLSALPTTMAMPPAMPCLMYEGRGPFSRLWMVIPNALYTACVGSVYSANGVRNISVRCQQIVTQQSHTTHFGRTGSF